MHEAGTKRSAQSGQVFELAHCDQCRYSCVVNPRSDFERLYDAAYYRGEGADPSVCYDHELAEPSTTREYEWRGILRAVQEMRPVTSSTEWLDFGCGLGGFVQYLRARGFDRAFGHDEGYAASRLRAAEIPSLNTEELASAAARFDVVTAVEVLEHALDPVAVLRQIAFAMKPGGTLVLTTGNARRYRGRLSTWSYVVPDVHVSYFEPDTLARAMREAGFTPSFPGYSRGWGDVIRYKVLKTLRVRRRNVVERLVPWSLVARVVDRRFGVTAQPVGLRTDE
jgi:SAM-dependent methyltransferase